MPVLAGFVFLGLLILAGALAGIWGVLGLLIFLVIAHRGMD